MPMAMPPGSIPITHQCHLTHFGNQNPTMMPAPCTTYMLYMPPNTVIEQQSVHIPQDSNDVATQLELKTPGSTSDKVRVFKKKNL